MAGEIAQYVASSKRRSRNEELLRKERIEEAWKELKILIDDFISIDPDLRRIVLFGSLATGNVRSSQFDIDLAIECTSSSYMSLVSRTLDSQFDIDLVELPRAPEYLREAIARDGNLLYER